MEEKTLRHVLSSDEEYATSGPLTPIFRNAIARILDQSLIVGRMEQTLAMFKESTNLSYKTVAKEVANLVTLGYMEEGRKMGNAKTFRFRVNNHLSQLIVCAQQMQLERLKMEATAK